MPTLSVCTLARNEESFLPKMLASVKDIATEIIVLDTGSTDRTMDVAREFGARVESEPWVDDFSVMRNKLLSYATGEWVLMLDADEQITKENVERIRAAMQKGSKAVVCTILNVFPYKLMNSLIPLQSTRLFKREPNFIFTERIHESINHALWKLTLLPSPSDIEIHHYGFTDEKSARRMRNRRNFEAEIKNNPTEAWVRMHLALSLFLEKDYTKSENYFDIILSSQSRDISPEARSIIMTLQAEIYRLQAKPVQSKMQAQRAMRLMSNNSLAEYIMALTDIEEKLFEVAERRLSTIDVNSLTQKHFTFHKGELYTEIVKCALRSGKIEKALQIAELMLETPTLDGMLLGGALAEKVKNYVEAIAFFTKALPLSPNPRDVQAKIDNCKRLLYANS